MGRNNLAFIVIGIIALALGIAIKLFVGRRRFYRRNQAGLEQYKNYRNALFTPFMETVLAFIGGMLVIVGLLSIAAAVLVGA
ncbi:MAG: molybdenum ABC transporter permease [Bacteroidia bacterium]